MELPNGFNDRFIGANWIYNHLGGSSNLNDTLPIHSIYTAPTSNYYIHGTQISNGCSTQKEYGGIVVNQVFVDPVFVGHPNFFDRYPDDSISCAVPSLRFNVMLTPLTQDLQLPVDKYRNRYFESNNCR